MAETDVGLTREEREAIDAGIEALDEKAERKMDSTYYRNEANAESHRISVHADTLRRLARRFT